MRSVFEKLRHYPALVLFFALLFGFFLVDMLYPDRAYSELENTNLKQRPAFNLRSLTNNEWTADYGDYVKEQVAFRDAWIDLQSRCESLLLFKCENGGILLGKDDMMFTRMYGLTSSEEKQLPKNLNAVVEFAQRHPGQVTFLLAPSASVVYAENLPFHAPMLDENAYLDDIFSQVGAVANVLDLRETFSQKKDEYIYYRTDHHWTTLGAFYAYEQFCQQNGLTPFDRQSHPAQEVENFLGTSYSAARTWNAVADTITYYPLDNQLTVYRITGENQFEVDSTGNLYDYSDFDTRDKYAAFLRGNNGYSTIEGDGEGSILIVKDSYANSFIPYLTANYEKIGVVDFRNFSYGIDSLMEAEGYDEVLILYNFQSFKSDARLTNLNRDPTE